MSANKVVLVMDAPKNCGSCPCVDSVDGISTWCSVTHVTLSKSMEILISRGVEFRPSSCPLKDMPEYKMDWSGEHSYESGFNDALDAIGGSRR